MGATEAHTLGTCVLIAGSLAITAQHVIADVFRRFGGKQDSSGITIESCELWIVKTTDDGDGFAIWKVERCWTSPVTDIAFLHLLPYEENAARFTSWKQPVINLLPPAIGTRVFGFGFHEPRTSVEIDAKGTKNVALNDLPTAIVGEVENIFHERRDNSMITFPSFQINCRSGHGMSGGPVFDENGHLCGIICSGDDYPVGGGYISNACVLWPMLGTRIEANRGANHPRDVSYPVLELARDGLIHAFGWQKVSIHGNEVRILRY